MKILFIASSFYPTRGGAQNYVYNLAQKLKSKGHDLIVFTGSNYMDVDFKGGKKYNWNGIDVYQTKTKRFKGLVVPYSLSGLKKIFDLLKSYDVVHLNDVRFLPFLL